jgi:hypothetical protein
VTRKIACVSRFSIATAASNLDLNCASVDNNSFGVFGRWRVGMRKHNREQVMAYKAWRQDVEEALSSMNMPSADWQTVWAFDFRGAFAAGIAPNDAAVRANQFWWREQNKALGQDCLRNSGCWLPRGHQGECYPTLRGSLSNGQIQQGRSR